MAHSITESLSSGSEVPEDKFGKLLKYSEEVAPVFEDLTGEQQERRLLDFVRNLNIVRQLNTTNDQLDIASSERRESDVLLEKLNRSKCIARDARFSILPIRT
jgi:hypothetical protein